MQWAPCHGSSSAPSGRAQCLRQQEVGDDAVGRLGLVANEYSASHSRSTTARRSDFDRRCPLFTPRGARRISRGEPHADLLPQHLDLPAKRVLVELRHALAVVIGHFEVNERIYFAREGPPCRWFETFEERWRARLRSKRHQISAESESSAQLLREQRRLLERGEMTAAVELVPVDEVGIDALGPAARRGEDLAREVAAPDGNIDAALEPVPAFSKYMRAEEAAVLGQPIERDVVEHLVARERDFRIAVIVGPGVKFLVDPRGLSHRQIREGVADRFAGASSVDGNSRSHRVRKRVIASTARCSSADSPPVGIGSGITSGKLRWMAGKARRPLLGQLRRDERRPNRRLARHSDSSRAGASVRPKLWRCGPRSNRARSACRRMPKPGSDGATT